MICNFLSVLKKSLFLLISNIICIVNCNEIDQKHTAENLKRLSRHRVMPTVDFTHINKKLKRLSDFLKADELNSQAIRIGQDIFTPNIPQVLFYIIEYEDNIKNFSKAFECVSGYDESFQIDGIYSSVSLFRDHQDIKASLLERAIFYNRGKIVKFLLSKKANVNQLHSKLHCSLLAYAILNNNNSFIKNKLRDTDIISPEEREKDHEDALECVNIIYSEFKENHISIIENLLDFGARLTPQEVNNFHLGIELFDEIQELCSKRKDLIKKFNSIGLVTKILEFSSLDIRNEKIEAGLLDGQNHLGNI